MIDLSPHHLETVKRILAEHLPDCEVRAFGSRATWTAWEYSDLDLAVVSHEPLDRRASANLREAFEESDLPIRVDVVDWTTLTDGFRQAIEGDCVVLQEATTPSRWRETTLGEVIELKRGYDLPKRQRVPGPVPLVSSSGISDHHTEAKVKGPGVVTGRYGTLGQVYYIQDDFWPLNTTLYVRDFKGNDPRFISYFLQGLDFFAYSDKAAVPGLNRNHLPHGARAPPPTRRTTTYRRHPRRPRRQDRTQPTHEPDPRSHGPSPLQVMVRRLRPRPSQGRQPTNRPPAPPGRALPTLVPRVGVGRDPVGLGARVTGRCGGGAKAHGETGRR